MPVDSTRARRHRRRTWGRACVIALATGLVVLLGGAYWFGGRWASADHRRVGPPPAEPKEFWPVPGAAHTNFQRFAPAAYEARLLAFLDRYLRRGAPSPAAGE